MRARELRALALPVALMVGAALVIQQVRPRLFDTVTTIKETSDTYALPPPEQLPTLSLGYRAALADLIWAYVMVTQGQRLKQRRRFEFAARYFDSIFALEPTYRQPYLLLEPILVFSTVKTRPEDIHEARRLLERGMRERPSDAQLFALAGSFMAYIAPGVLPEEEHAEWRRQGAELMMKAGEMGADDVGVQWRSLSSVALLSRAGERAAAISFLERIHEVTEDSELRAEVLRQMRVLKAEESAERAQRSAQRFEETWRHDLPFVSRSMMLLLGPPSSTWDCAGPGHQNEAACARDWKTWTRRSR